MRWVVKTLRRQSLRYCLLLLLCAIIYYVFHNSIRNITSDAPIIIHWPKFTINMSCHYSLEGDALPSAEDPSFSPGDKAIFFHETSCRGGIDSRQACVLESAARLHPKWQINLLFSSPVTEYILRKSNLAKLLEFRNIKPARVHLEQYAKNTVLEKTLTYHLNKSLYPVEHAADILRIITLYKFGGIYLDTDFLVIENIDSLPPNWIAKEAYRYIASGAMAFAKDEAGTNMTQAILTEFNNTFDPSSWSHNGAKAIQRVLKRVCLDRIRPGGNCKEKPMIIYWPKTTDDVHCHHTKEGDALPSAEDLHFAPGKKIFFHETSCRGGINSRQACVLESAARLHPKWQVTLLFSSPVTEIMLRRSNLAKFLQFQNVKLARVHIEEYGKGTVVEQTLAYYLNKSTFPVEHTSDILRIVTLQKFGGVYLDTDFMLTESLDSLPPNWIAKETNDMLAAGAMAFEKDEAGKNMTEAILIEFNNTYDPESWSYNGAQAIHRVLGRICRKAFKGCGNCEGVQILSPPAFYPLLYDRFSLYFLNGSIDSMVGPYMHHMWNRFTKYLKIQQDSPYAKLARKFCPTIYQMYGDQFGD